MTTREARGLSATETEEESVAAYLQHNPEFFERHQALLACDLTHVRMIDHDEIVALRQFRDRKRFEVLQRATVPFDAYSGARSPDRGAGNERIVAPRVVPGHATQVPLRLD